LGVAQPALSQAIARLESQVGVKLLERHARGVRLTRAGERLYAKAHVALTAVADADRTARTFARAGKSVIEFGFIGSPPMLDAPELFAALAAIHPEMEVSFRELPFPGNSMSAWLGEADVALCFSPTPDPQVQAYTLRVEPRVLMAADNHPLATRRELSVAEVLDETFPGYHPSIDQRWVAYWRLDDCREGIPARVTADRALNPQEVAAIIASGRAVSTAPASSAVGILPRLRSVVAIRLSDASPTELTLVWRADIRNALVDALVATAKQASSEPR